MNCLFHFSCGVYASMRPRREAAENGPGGPHVEINIENRFNEAAA